MQQMQCVSMAVQNPAPLRLYLSGRRNIGARVIPLCRGGCHWLRGQPAAGRLSLLAAGLLGAAGAVGMRRGGPRIGLCRLLALHASPGGPRRLPGGGEHAEVVRIVLAGAAWRALCLHIRPPQLNPLLGGQYACV